MKRPKVSVFLALSLDGYIADESGDTAWLAPYSTDAPERTGFSQLMGSIDTMVFGRNTYDTVSSFEPWPYAGKRIVVMTHRELVPVHWAEVWDGSLENLLQKLEQEGCRHIYLDGGAAVRQGLELDVADELTLSWVPVVLGRGIPLFVTGLPAQNWHLKESRTLPSGLLQGIYTRRKA